MILIDANLLLYAYVPESDHHRRARAWLEGTFSEREPVGLAWVVILAFLRIGTNPRVFRHPFSLREAGSIVSEWLAQPAVKILQAEERHWTILSELLPAAQAASELVMDAHLAALAIEHGATLCTNDRDFTRFPGLRVQYPLDAEVMQP